MEHSFCQVTESISILHKTIEDLSSHQSKFQQETIKELRSCQNKLQQEDGRSSDTTSIENGDDEPTYMMMIKTQQINIYMFKYRLQTQKV